MVHKAVSVLIALFFLPVVFALSEDFILDAPQQIVPVFFCAPAQSQFTITNTGEITSAYSVVLEGSASTFATVDFPSFSLDPAKSALLTIAYAVPCELKSTATLSIRVRTSSGVEKSITQSIIPYTPDNIDATMTPSEVTISPCEQAQFNVSLRNPVNYIESYNISIDGIDFARPMAQVVTLLPAQMQNLNFTLQPTNCSMHGSFPFSVKIRTTKSGIEEGISGLITIAPDFIPLVLFERARYTNYYEEREIPVSIKNVGQKNVTYDASLHGPAFASLTTMNATIGPMSTETLLIRVAPDTNVSQGTYTISIKLIVRETGTMYVSEQISLVLKQHTILTRFYVDHPVSSVVILIAILTCVVVIVLMVFIMSRPAYRQKRTQRREERAKIHEQQRQEELVHEGMRRAAQEKEKHVALADTKEAIAQVRKDYFLIKKSKEGFEPMHSREKAVVIIVLAAVICLSILFAWNYWSFIMENVLTIAIALVVLATIIIMFIIRKYRSIDYFTRRELNIRERELALRKNLAEERESVRAKIRAEKEAWATQKQEKKRALVKSRNEVQKHEEHEVKSVQAMHDGESDEWFGVRIIASILLLAIAAGLVWVYWPILLPYWNAYWTYWKSAVAILAALIVLCIGMHWYRKRHVMKQWRIASGWTFVQTKWHNGLGDVRFKLPARTGNVQIRIDRGRASDVFIVPASAVYQYFRINISEQAQQPRISFRVKKSWAKKHDVALYRFNNGAWSNTAAKHVSDDARYRYYVADVREDGQFAIAGAAKVDGHGWWPWFVAIVVLSIAIVLAGIFMTNTAAPKFNGISLQEWSENSVHVLDLTKFFSDPDGDSLQFSITPINHIDVFIDRDGKAVFTPEYGFVGEEAVIFTARDNRGGVVQSNRVILRITKSPIPTEYLPYVKWGVVLILAILLLLVLIRFRKRVSEYMNEERA